MPKPTSAALQKAAENVVLQGFDYEVTLDTTLGRIRLTLDPAVAPGHVRNMVALAESGFYDGIPFHRVIKGFMIQGGCPEGTGTGGPGYRIRAEFNATPHEAGVLSMARTNDPNSAGSQFFVCLDRVPHLDNQYTAFGKTADAASLEVVRAIGNVRTGANDRPVEPVVITKATVTRIPRT
jgi:peptidyl-prolyl cis-trans isomerase B (cyclophilin B)